ncbi:MAG: ABC transporter transmembrane domain-containing protein, partial [Candidatus Woesebacteria bacterium]|nr:ABC transporter transmembrane domain-containing protein [Candidatus Woesebacteria bacterium]
MLKVLRTFYGFIFEKKAIFIGFIFLVLISNILFSINPYFYKLFVDQIPSLNFGNLFKILLIYITVRVFAVISDIATFWVGDVILFKSSIDARVKIFKKVQDLDFAFHTEKSTGSLISSFKRGDSAFFSFFHDIHHRMLSVLISFLVMLYFFAQLNWIIVILVSASIIIILAVTKLLIANNMNKRKVFNKEEDDISGIITDNLINFETVKLFSKEVWEEKRLKNTFIP